MNFIEYVASGFLLLGALYLAVRLASAAYFKSKQQHEKQRNPS